MRRDILVWVACGGLVGCGDDGENRDATTGPETPTATATDSGATTSTSTTTGTSGDPETTSSSSTSTSTSTSGPSGSSSGVGESSTGSSSESSSTGTAARCPDGSECFFLPGTFHVADEATPTAEYNIALEGPEFSVVEVELDVTHSGWYSDDPGGLHNVFWLHRGQIGNFTWQGGVLGYVNARGPGRDLVRTRHDMDAPSLDEARNFNINNVVLDDGTEYHWFYRYDVSADTVTVELSSGGMIIASGTDGPTAASISNNDGGFFIYFGNGTDVELPGPEVPSLGWAFSDLRVEFIP